MLSFAVIGFLVMNCWMFSPPRFFAIPRMSRRLTIPQILSNFSALGYSAGDVLSTGTVSGVAGFKSEEERRRLYLKPGDVIEAEIERIGVLRSPVISWQEGHGEPARPRIRPWGEA